MPTVHLPNLDLYFESHGQGTPLLLLNGLGLDVAAWGPQLATLSRHYRVIALDWRGSGRSTPCPPPYRIAALATDALALLDSLGIERAHLLGLSMGGMVAQRLAVDHPSRVRGVILAASAARLPPRTRHVIDLWARMAASGTAPEVLLREQLAWVFADDFYADEGRMSQVLDMFLANPHPPSPQGIAGQAAACLDHDTRNELGRLRAPTLALVGQEDRLLPMSASEELVQAIAGARLAVVDRAGHAFATERAERFNELVLGFLAEIDGRSQGTEVTCSGA